MCLAVPARVVETRGLKATVDVMGNTREADLSLVGALEAGAYVLLHAGFAIQTLEPDDAIETLRLFEELAAQTEGGGDG